MAGDELVGNMNTEYIITYLEEQNQLNDINKEALQKGLHLLPLFSYNQEFVQFV
jgi:hypothetical protein